MRPPLDLPPININARGPKPNFGSRAHPGGPPFTPPMMNAIARHQRLRAYLKGDWQQILNILLTDALRNNPPLNGPLKEDLATAHSADQFMCRNPQLSAEDAWRKGWSKAKAHGNNIDKNENELSGGAFSPIKALAHAISGEGTPLQIKIENTGIKPNPNSVPALRALIESAPIGSSPVFIDRVSYNTGIDSKVTEYYLGHISLKIEGQVHKHDQHHYSFAGEVRAYHDFYDANRSSHRDWMAETATTALNTIMQAVNSQGYEIAITGSLPINYSQ